MFVPNVPIAAGTFCDTGNRFRRNSFFRIDFWLVQNEELNPFYDYVFYNSDCYVVDKQNRVIGELFFRFEVD